MPFLYPEAGESGPIARAQAVSTPKKLRQPSSFVGYARLIIPYNQLVVKPRRSSPHNQISRSSACGLHRTVFTKPNSFRLMQMREAARIWCPLSLTAPWASKVGPRDQKIPFVAAHRIFRWKKPRTSEYKIWYVSVWLFPEKGKESFLPPGTPLSRTDFLRKGFLRDCRGRAYKSYKAAKIKEV